MQTIIEILILIGICAVITGVTNIVLIRLIRRGAAVNICVKLLNYSAFVWILCFIFAGVIAAVKYFN
jgi:hypothetical protein